ncbi:hypothetical protein CFD26_105007 [Aspergillus turcosus]|uniref:Uncharacterized protein n=1 Tax=Aspergillus turcosus TaxID=1245748 RepID=A0A3R7F4F2_9EURO|nr:hypothetical protein CFD26_105007 [Aspergillus turcosus]
MNQTTKGESMLVRHHVNPANIHRYRQHASIDPTSFGLEVPSELHQRAHAIIGHEIFLRLRTHMAVDDDDVVPVQSTRPPTVFKVIGDHQQLRPLVFSRAKENPFQSQLQISLFTRLKLNGFMDVMFTDQHCMVGDLCNMISDVFYASKLSTAANLEDTVPALGSLSPERDKPVEPANALPLAPAPAALPAATVLAVVNNFSRSVMGLSMHHDVNFTIECYPWDGRSSPQYKNAGEYGSRGMVEKILPYIQRSHQTYCSLMSTLLSKCSRKECEEVLRLIKNSGNAGASACSMETAAPLDAPTESSQSEEEFASSGTIVPQTQSGVGVRAPQIPTPEVPESSIARRPSMPLWNPCNRKKGALLPSMVLDDDSEFSYTSTQSVLTNATTAPANATDIVHILRKVCPRMLAIAKEWIDIEGSAEPPTEETTAKIVQALAELGYLIGDELGRADNV